MMKRTVDGESNTSQFIESWPMDQLVDDRSIPRWETGTNPEDAMEHVWTWKLGMDISKIALPKQNQAIQIELDFSLLK